MNTQLPVAFQKNPSMIQLTKGETKMIDISKFKAFCVHGEVTELIDYLKSNDDDLTYLEKYQKRFEKQEPTQFATNDSLLEDILHQYEKYYVSTFYRQVPSTKAEEELLQNLKQATNQINALSMQEIEIAIQQIFEEKGYIFRGGKTSSYYGPYIWKSTSIKVFQVELPEETVQLPIHFMKGFVMNSWVDYLSFSITGTGGWSTEQGLFCNYDRYEHQIDEPKFQISFLKHESQHHLDYQNTQYEINVPLLEYRAKLCELTYYPNTDLIISFLKSAKNDELLTHSIAEYWLVQDLSQLIFHENYVSDFKKWESKLPEIQSYSKTLLMEYNRCKKVAINEVNEQ